MLGELLRLRYLMRVWVCELWECHGLLVGCQQLALPHLRYHQVNQLEGLLQEVDLRFPIDQ